MTVDFSTFIIIAAVLAVLGVIATIVFWVVVVILGLRAAKGYQKQVDAMLNNYSKNLSSLSSTYGSNIPPEMQQQVFSQYLKAQNQMRHFDELSQARQDTFRADMLSQASSAGIDVSGW